MHTIAGKNFLTTVEAARRIGVAPGTLRNWRTDRLDRIHGVKLGSVVLYSEDDVTAYVAGRSK